MGRLSRFWLAASLILLPATLLPAGHHQFHQTWMNGGVTPSASATNYLPISGRMSGSTTENNLKCLAAAAGTLTNFRPHLNTAVGASKSLLVAVRVEGATSTLSQTFADASTVNLLDTDLVSISAGNEIDIITTPGSTPTVSDITAAVDFLPTTPNLNAYCGGTAGTALNGTTTQYLRPHAVDAPGGVEFNAGMLMPFAGSISALYMEMSGSPDNGAGTQTFGFTVRKNGTTNSDCTCTISETATTCNDTTCSTTFVAGDYINIAKTVDAGTPNATRVAYYGIAVISNTPGAFSFSGTGEAPSTSAVSYNRPVSGFGSAWTTTDDNTRKQNNNECYAQAMYVNLTVAPANGAGTQSYKIDLDNGGSTALSVTVSEAATTGSITGNATLSAASLLRLISTPANTPAATDTQVGILCFTPPKRGIWVGK